MIIATHSEYVIRSALEDKDNVLVIVLRNDNGSITPIRMTNSIILPNITAAEINYTAFGIPSIDYHIQLYGYLQNLIDCNESIKKCDEYICNQKSVYIPSLHEKKSSYKRKDNGYITNYVTLPTYIRNAIDHPESSKKYTDEEFETSIKLLIQLCTEAKKKNQTEVV